MISKEKVKWQLLNKTCETCFFREEEDGEVYCNNYFRLKPGSPVFTKDIAKLSDKGGCKYHQVISLTFMGEKWIKR